MEQVQLTTKEIFEYVIKTLDNEVMGCSRQINFDPSVIHSTITLNGLSREEQLEAIYDHFISIYHLSTDNILYSNMVSYSDYAPFNNLYRIVTSAMTKTHDKLTDNEYKAVWLYNKIESAIKSTVNKMSYKELFIDNGCTLSAKALPRKTIDYREESEHYFKVCLSERPDRVTINLIDKLKIKVEKYAEREISKIKATGDNDKITILINKTREDIIDAEEIQFYDEWLDDNMPTTKDTLKICKWESRGGYERFIELVLRIDLLEEAYYEYRFPKQLLRNRAIKRKAEEENKKNETNYKIKKWIEDCFSTRIKDEEIQRLYDCVERHFNKSNTCPNIQITNVKELIAPDIISFGWVIWYLYRKGSNPKIKQDEVAKFLKAIFPVALKGIEETTIKNKLKDDGGTYIKIPSEYKKGSISNK